LKRSSKKESKETAPQLRLERAIKYWIEHDPVATIEEIKRVADKYQVHWRSLREAIRMMGSLDSSE